MTKEQTRRKYQIISMMLSTAKNNGKESNYLSMIYFAERLHRLETTLSRLANDECCNENYDYKKQERIENLAEKLIRETIGCECFTQRDPRGFHIRMYLTDENGNKWFNTWDGKTTGLDW